MSEDNNPSPGTNVEDDTVAMPRAVIADLYRFFHQAWEGSGKDTDEGTHGKDLLDWRDKMSGLHRKTLFIETHRHENAVAQGEFEIIQLGTKGACGMTRISPDGWWLKLPVGNYKIVAVPIGVLPSPETKETVE